MVTGRGEGPLPRGVLVLAWTPIGGRPPELARALDGEAAVLYPLRGDGAARKVARYAASAALTVGLLARRRPRALVVTNPPPFPGLIGLLYARASGARFVLDSHPGGFGLQGDRLSARLRPLVRRLVARADATLVTEETLAGLVSSWGGRPLVVHEAPPTWTVPEARPLGLRRPQVLFVGVFQRDEPVELVLEAARALPEADVAVTGDPAKAPPGLVDSAPANVSFTGFLGPQAYVDALAAADVVLAVTTEPTSVVRAGYEAVWAGRPLVLSDTPALRDVFPHAVHAATTGPGLAAGLREAIARHDDLRAVAEAARAEQEARWERQRASLRRITHGG